MHAQTCIAGFYILFFKLEFRHTLENRILFTFEYVGVRHTLEILIWPLSSRLENV